jgi:hypothetical protein
MICPFCSLLCDEVDSQALDRLNCARRQNSLVHLRSLRSEPTRCDDDQRDVDASRQALRSASHVLVTGRIASVETARAALQFAAKYNATIDCAEDGNVFKNTLAIQRSGMNSVSLAEARDLSDVFIVVGNDSLLQSVPRMPNALANTSQADRLVLLLGDYSDVSINAWNAVGFNTWQVPIELDRIPAALSQWSKWTESKHGLVKLPETHCTHALFTSLHHAKYMTVIWSAETIRIEQADLWIESMLQWIASQNEHRRCTAIPWSSLDGTFQQVCTWTTGFPGRVYFRNGIPEYDPASNSYERWLRRHVGQTESKSVVVMIDETANPSSFAKQHHAKWSAPATKVAGTFHVPFAEPIAVPFAESLEPIASRTSSNSNTHWIELSGSSANFPTKIAGAEGTADMFRADQTVLARVRPPHEERSLDNSRQNGQLKSASEWLEELSK